MFLLKLIVVNAVQTQYLFLHRALLEAYTARAAVISADRFDVIFPQPITADSANEHIDREFKVHAASQCKASESNRSCNKDPQEHVSSRACQ